MKLLEQLCEEHGIQLQALPGAKYRLTGIRIVDYWPRSKKHTAHLVEENRTAYGVKPIEAVRLAQGHYLKGRTWAPRELRRRVYSLDKQSRRSWIASGAREGSW